MDCRTCQPTLLDLAYGELAPEFAAESREHMQGCASCRASYERLSQAIGQTQQLEMLEPPATLERELMSLASAHVEKRKRERELEAARRGGFAQTLLELLARMANARQVAMATIMLLIIGVGLWSIPELQRGPAPAGVTVVNPDPQGEAAPSQGLRPAEPLDLTVDARSRRIRTREEEQKLAAARQSAAEAAAAAEAQSELRAEEQPAPEEQLAKRSSKDDLGLDDIDAVFAPSRSTSGGAVSARSRSRKRLASADGDRAELERAAKPKAAPQSQEGLLNPYKKEAPAAAPAAVAEADALAEEGSPANVGRAAGPAQASEKQSVDATATSLASARAARASSGCSAALPLYERVRASSPSAGDRNAALLEAAECYISIGRTEQARSILSRALENASVRTRAQELLRSLDDVPAKGGVAREIEAAEPAAPAEPSGARD